MDDSIKKRELSDANHHRRASEQVFVRANAVSGLHHAPPLPNTLAITMLAFVALLMLLAFVR
jgi:hypothetical protein